MPVCQNCGTEWTWKQTIKNLFRLKCPHSAAKQFISAKSRWKTNFLSILLIYPFHFLNIFLDLEWLALTIFFIASLAIYLIVHPFLLELSNEQEPYW